MWFVAVWGNNRRWMGVVWVATKFKALAPSPPADPVAAVELPPTAAAA